jgi:hypothetical protein
MSKPESFTEIHDMRMASEFKSVTFSKYKKTDVRSQLIDSMKNGKLEPACYWCAELICAGHFMEIWEIILHYTGKHIHLGNPKIVSYLEMRFQIFKNIVAQGQFLNELQLRNHVTIRKLFAEIITVMTLSNRKHSFEPIKINREEEFDMTQMPERLKAPSIEYATSILKKEDPRELFIAVNEFCYHLSPEIKTTIGACYWIEWMIDFEAICKKKKTPCICVRRSDVQVEKKLQSDVIWILWEALFFYSEKKNNPFIDKLMHGLRTIFCIKYTTASCKKRRFLLYFAVALLKDPVPTNIDLISAQNKLLLENLLSKIDQIYKQIKKNEEAPRTEYLFAGLERENNFEKSMRKLDMLNNMDGAIPKTSDP